MRSLNRSLPRTSPQRRTQQPQQGQPPEDLLSAFKAAALSVTTLYKSAAQLQIPAKAAGYQEALEDLLHFLDKENLGLCDGEGWSVRQWATERLDGNNTGHNESEDDEEQQEEDDKVVESSAPAPTESKDSTQDEDLTGSVELSAKDEERNATPPQSTITSLGSDASFTFRAPLALPTNHDRDNMDGIVRENHDSTTHSHPRHRRQRTQQRPGNSVRASLGAGAGSKRRFPLGDFFDLSGINFDGKDPGLDRTNKRTKH